MRNVRVFRMRGVLFDFVTITPRTYCRVTLWNNTICKDLERFPGVEYWKQKFVFYNISKLVGEHWKGCDFFNLIKYSTQYDLPQLQYTHITDPTIILYDLSNNFLEALQPSVGRGWSDWYASFVVWIFWSLKVETTLVFSYSPLWMVFAIWGKL